MTLPLLFLKTNWKALVVAAACLVAVAFVWDNVRSRKKAERGAAELRVEVSDLKKQAIELQSGIHDQNQSIEAMNNKLNEVKAAVGKAQQAAGRVKEDLRKALAENQQAPTEAAPALDWAVERGHQLNRAWEGK